MAADPIIEIEGLWKSYERPLELNPRRLLRRLRDGKSQPGDPQYHWALKGVNLKLNRGEILGIIGKNGSGKSTLLKILAGVSPPTFGKVHVRGRVFPMIELNTGIDADLTGRENVCLLSAIMGFSQREIDRNLPRIEEFCDLGDYFDEPVRKYSSGMRARLGFAVAVHTDADVLLIDEVLSVGDIEFQNRCFRKMKELRDRGATMLFVSHSLVSVQQLCRTAITLRNGNLIDAGDAGAVAARYEQTQFEAIADDIVFQRRERSKKFFEAAGVVLEKVHIEVPGIGETRAVPFGSPFDIVINCAVSEEAKDVRLNLGIQNQKYESCIDVFLEIDLGGLTGVPVEIRVAIPGNPLNRGVYIISFSLRDAISTYAFGRFKDVLSFRIDGALSEIGILSLPITCRVVPARIPAAAE
jgi:lipopolysaccharide transport system ATP-binding protein